MSSSRNYLTHWGDIITIFGYFALVMAVGIWSICRPTRNSIRGYFLAGRSMTWWPIALSLFASNIGSEHVIGLAGTGSASGIAVIMFEWNAGLCLLALGWIFAPVYIASGCTSIFLVILVGCFHVVTKSQVYTMPEYLAKRFGGSRLRIYLSLVTLVSSVFINITVNLYSGGLFFAQATGLSMYVGIALLLCITAIYSGLGGLSTIIYTNAIQVVVMLLGSFVLTIMGFIKIGGYGELERRYMLAVTSVTHSVHNTTNATMWGNNESSYGVTNATFWQDGEPRNVSSDICGQPREDAFHIFRDFSDSEYPWFGTFLRSSIASMHYWCATQVIVQRTLAAKNISHAKGGTIAAGYLKILPLFIMVWPGMISRILFPDTVGCVTSEECMAVCQNPVGCSNIAYPKLVLELMPTGLRGLLFAVLMSALVSPLTSTLGSASTIFSLDLWTKLRPQSGEKELLIVGKLFVAAMCAIGIVWIPIMATADGGQIFLYGRTIGGYFGSPVAAIFILAMFWRRTNEPGAFWGLVAGQILGITRFVLDFIYPAPGCGQEDSRPGIVSGMHPFYLAVLQMVVATIVAIPISCLTPQIPEEKLRGLMFWTRWEKPHYVKDEEEEQRCPEQDAAEPPNQNNVPACGLLLQDTKPTLKSLPDDASDDVAHDVPEVSSEGGAGAGLPRRCWDRLCGLSQNKLQHENNEAEDYHKRMTSLTETKKMSWFLHGQALLLLLVLTTVYIIFR